MASGTMTFTASTLNHLTSSLLLERPYLKICRKNQKKKKPQFSKLSILTKSSMCSTKVTSNEYKRRQQRRSSKSIDRKMMSCNVSRDKKKVRSNSCKHRMDKTIKVQRLGLSYQPQDFQSLQKQTPMSRTVCKKMQQTNSISPLYSSLICNSVQQHYSPEGMHKDLSKILERTSHMLSNYKQHCGELRKQRDFYKKKYHKLAAKIKRMERSCFKQRF